MALLPGGERDWLAALRRATDHLYARALAPSGRRWFLDKTPAYALVLDFVAKLYPDARYVVLTRHPMAVWSSCVESFFDGDAAAAHARNPILERYVPAIARFLREPPVPLVHVRYEALVTDPEATLREICGHLGVDFEPGMIEYGRTEAATKTGRGLGDPITVDRESRPTTRSVGKWAEALAADPALLSQCRAIAERLADEDLALWGTPGPELRKTLAELGPFRRGPSEAPAHALRARAAPARAAAPEHPAQRLRAPGARGCGAPATCCSANPVLHPRACRAPSPAKSRPLPPPAGRPRASR